VVLTGLQPSVRPQHSRQQRQRVAVAALLLLMWTCQTHQQQPHPPLVLLGTVT
jgi:hypothetical protein